VIVKDKGNWEVKSTSVRKALDSEGGVGWADFRAGEVSCSNFSVGGRKIAFQKTGGDPFLIKLGGRRSWDEFRKLKREKRKQKHAKNPNDSRR